MRAALAAGLLALAGVVSAQHAQPAKPPSRAVQTQGAQVQGAQPQGAQPQGAQPQGAQPQGAQPQGAQPQGAQPQGQPISQARLRDPDFGVSTQRFGLQRRVEMYQWRREGTGYTKAWETQPIDSSGFDAPHANPEAFPVQTRYWIADRVMLDGKPVDEDVLKVLGQWREFRPGFSALPGNLSATFQPEGDGLASAENPLDPQIGDLRITWHQLSLPSLTGKVVLEDNLWVVVPDAARQAAAIDATGASADDGSAQAWRGWWLPGILLIVIVALVLVRRRRRE